MVRRARPPAAPTLPARLRHPRDAAHLRTTPDIAGYDHSWFIPTQRIVKKEFALSGSEQNPDITTGERKAFVRQRVLNKAAPDPVEAFKQHGEDFVVADSLEELVARMNTLTDEAPLDAAGIRRRSPRATCNWPTRSRRTARSWHPQRPQVPRRPARTHRAAARILDPDDGPLIGVKLHILTRKTLGGIQTDLSSRAIGRDGEPIRASTPPARSPASAAAACTATTRWKARSSAAASSPAAPPDARSPRHSVQSGCRNGMRAKSSLIRYAGRD